MMQRTTYHIPKMDCPAEEQLIRMTLAGSEGIRSLEFDLASRTLTVMHSAGVQEITKQLTGLNLGATVALSSFAQEASPLSSEPGPSEHQEQRVLWALLAINGVMFIAELILGWLAESTGLIADSLDMLADAAIYGISLYAVGKTANHKVRAARVSGWFQLALALGALFEVLRRFIFGSEPKPPLMIVVAALALIANVVCLWLIAKHRDRGAHMKASWIFSTNDVIANIGVIVAGALVALTGSRLPDLAIGTLIAAVVFSGSVRILRLR